ncbi:MerR family transcriptional regulator [Brevibacillus fluminis]|uniref:MerR family transcriptional regulator n=1 Tax=Brevibacillus fluminis TaxID=511487 RepID=A0A3M8DC60_9BACL|nr:MerR family transcriptional regulator [Brevibacillus fluminis]
MIKTGGVSLQTDSRNDTNQRGKCERSTYVRKYTIGEVAKLTNSNVRTVRYYDEIGLLKPAEVTSGKYRLYTTEEIWRLKLILTLRYLGFGMYEIRNLISGERSVTKVINWQIEVLNAQIRTLTNIKEILQQTTQSDYGEDSLRYMHDLVESIALSSAERKQFILEKMKDSMFPDEVPYEWREALLKMTKSIFYEEGKLSAVQISALNEIEKMLDDPEFIAAAKLSATPYLNMILSGRMDIPTWDQYEQEIYSRLFDALQQKATYDSEVVQSIIHDYVTNFAKGENVPYTLDYFRKFAEKVLSLDTNKMNCFLLQCITLNPRLKWATQVNALFMKGIQWKLAQME